MILSPYICRRCRKPIPATPTRHRPSRPAIPGRELDPRRPIRPFWRRPDGYRGPLSMAAGDVMLDSSGNVILDSSGNVLLDNGSGNGCCCITPVCGGHGSTLRINVTGVDGTVPIGSNITNLNNGNFENLSSATFDGTFCLPFLGSSPCRWGLQVAGAAAGTQHQTGSNFTIDSVQYGVTISAGTLTFSIGPHVSGLVPDPNVFEAQVAASSFPAGGSVSLSNNLNGLENVNFTPSGSVTITDVSC